MVIPFLGDESYISGENLSEIFQIKKYDGNLFFGDEILFSGDGLLLDDPH